jgi:hypothetical protein
MDLSPGPVERKHTQIDALLFMHGEGHETLIDFQSLLPHSSHRPFTLLCLSTSHQAEPPMDLLPPPPPPPLRSCPMLDSL